MKSHSAEKFSVCCEDKTEAGSRGVVCERSGFCHGAVSTNQPSVYIRVVGFEAQAVCASFFRVPSLLSVLDFESFE